MRISIGRYIPGNSVLHSMDPRQKIISSVLIVVSVLLCGRIFEYVFPGLFLIYSISASRIGLGAYLKGVKSIWLILAFAVLIQLISYGIADAIFIGLRLLIIMLAGEVLTYTTRPTNLASSMEDVMRWMGFSRRFSQEFSTVMGIALRFAPVMLDEADRIVKAQISRGAPIDSGRVLERLKALSSVVIPLMSSAVRKSEELAIAMEARRYIPGSRRTRYRQPEWKPLDTFNLLFSITVLLITAVV